MKAIKPLAVAALLAVAIPSIVSAQEDRAFTIGARGGIGFSDLAGDVNFDSRVGFSAGVFGGLQLSELWSIYPELSFQQKGAKDIGIQVPVVERTVKISYIELQLPLVLYPEMGASPLTPRLYGGPYGAFKVACTKSIEDETGASSSSDCDEGTPSEVVPIKSVDFGIVIGAGLDLGGAERGGFTIDIRYDIGLGNINDASGGGDVMNRVIQILVGYAHR
jgi:hypothetical protein